RPREPRGVGPPRRRLGSAGRSPQGAPARHATLRGPHAASPRPGRGEPRGDEPLAGRARPPADRADGGVTVGSFRDSVARLEAAVTRLEQAVTGPLSDLAAAVRELREAWRDVPAFDTRAP